MISKALSWIFRTNSKDGGANTEMQSGEVKCRERSVDGLFNPLHNKYLRDSGFTMATCPITCAYYPPYGEYYDEHPGKLVARLYCKDVDTFKFACGAS